VDDGIIARAVRLAEAERDQRMSHPWDGPSKTALAIRTGEALVTAHDLEWARDLTALVPPRATEWIALAVAEGFCPAHLAPLAPEGTPFPWCRQCKAGWTVSRIVRSVVFLDKPRGGVWRRLVLFPLPSGSPGSADGDQ
jgi:hypothetical protein